jgi:hypothetical protein
LQRFENSKDAALVADVLSFVTNEPIDTTIDGDSWIVQSEIGLPVALYLLVDMDLKSDPNRWLAAMLAWETWRKGAAGTTEYREVASAAWELRKSPKMKNSKLYISPQKLARWKKEEEDEEFMERLVKDPNYQEDCENQIKLGHSWRDGSWEWDDPGD